MTDVAPPFWTPRCDRCGELLSEPGAVLLAPPDTDNNRIVQKFHFCLSCFDFLFREVIRP